MSITNTEIFNGIIARYTRFREEIEVEGKEYDEETGEVVTFTYTEHYFTDNELISSYDALEKGHPNYIICQTLMQYLKQEIGIHISWNAEVAESLLWLLRNAYHKASKTNKDKQHFFSTHHRTPPNKVPPQTAPKDIHECLFSPMVENSITLILLQLDSSIMLYQDFITQAEAFCTKPLVRPTERCFYPLLRDKIQKHFPDSLNATDPRISAVFKHTSDFVKMQVASAIDKCEKTTDHAFLELILFEKSYIKTANSHKAFINALQSWGLLKDEINKAEINTRQKFNKLENKPKNQWSTRDKRKYDEIALCFQ